VAASRVPGLLAWLAMAGGALAQQQGGILRQHIPDNPASLSIHEESTVTGHRPALPRGLLARIAEFLRRKIFEARCQLVTRRAPPRPATDILDRIQGSWPKYPACHAGSTTSGSSGRGWSPR
jgi:hypothetical protein